MALHQFASSRARRVGTPQASRLTGDPRRRLLRAQERLPLATAAEGLSALEDRLRLVQEMAHRRDVGASEHRTARAPAFAAWQEPEPQRRDRRLPIRKNDRRGRRAKRLRRWQEGPRPQEAPAGGY